jgi:hypothetical protein
LRALARSRRGNIPLIVTCFGTVTLAEDTCRAIEEECPGFMYHTDRRTKQWRRQMEIQRDIEAIAEVEWLHGGDLMQF